jgi:hypothetical protein
MQPDSPQSGHFFGLQRVSTALPHFSQVKVAMKASCFSQVKHEGLDKSSP